MLSSSRFRSPIPSLFESFTFWNGSLTQTMHVEFLGVPRERAGVAELEVHAETLGQLLATLAVRLPSLRELIVMDRLHPACVANLNGDQFVSDPSTPLAAGDSVLILSADAGG